MTEYTYDDSHCWLCNAEIEDDGFSLGLCDDCLESEMGIEEFPKKQKFDDDVEGK